MPPGATGEPAGLGRVPLKLPQATQSIVSQQTAPPAEERDLAASGASAATPNCASACGDASSKVLWFASPLTSWEKDDVAVTFPVVS